MSTPQQYLNPFTDFGFKKLFGEALGKELLLDFLNEVLKSETDTIKDLNYLPTQHLGKTENERHAVFDLYCENESGEKFIVELQRGKQQYFKDRSVYYSTFALQEQAKKGCWNFKLDAVYTISILDFTFDDTSSSDTAMSTIKLVNIDTLEVFFNKLTFVYLEMPKFRKSEKELETKFDKWLYVLRNLGKLTNRPKALQERVFHTLFKAANISKLDSGDLMAYEKSLEEYRDVMDIRETARIDGRNQGLSEGRREGHREGHREGQQEGVRQERLSTIQKLKKSGMSNTEISNILNLSLDDIQELLSTGKNN